MVPHSLLSHNTSLSHGGTWPSELGSLSDEQLGPRRGELHVDPGLVLPQPALGDRAFETGAVFGRDAASVEERQIDQLDTDAWRSRAGPSGRSVVSLRSGSINQC
jgi:hypothetical protein